MAKKDRPRKGDRVAWKTHGTETTGKVEEEITERTQTGGRTVDASLDDPQYNSRSEKSGRPAVHKPRTLKKKKKSF